MSRLGERIARLIEADGPLGLADYMAVCMADPHDGYYIRREAIGATGDFVTAPEISQMFGEMIGVWCVAAWQALGRPAPILLGEAGPGKGTLMADLLRAARRFPDFASAIEVCLIETSDAMRACQREKLAAFSQPVSWRGSIEELPPGPLILIANEFLDVLPVRQYVKSGGVWRERCIGLDENGRLAWTLGSAVIAPALLPAGADTEPDGAVVEIAPARLAWTETLAARLSRDGGLALLIDYGHAQSGFGDTFQAVRNHRFADPLAEPGLADLTAHVDFAALARAARQAGARASPIVTQGEFLLAMGLLERAGQLGARADEALRQRLREEAERLAHPDHMGNLFKILALSGGNRDPASLRFPPFSTPAKGS